jgi:hypothetical protein
MTQHLENHPHAFLDQNNKVLNVAIFDENGHDSDLIQVIKNDLQATEVICCCSNGIAYVGGYWRNNKFTDPQPYPSWTYDEITLTWVPPVSKPEDAVYTWNEDKLEWEFLIAFPTE